MIYSKQIEIDRGSVITKMRYLPQSKEYLVITATLHEVDGRVMTAAVERCFAKGRFESEVDKGTFTEFLNRVQNQILIPLQ